jgi:hypothetical protein
MTKQPKRPRDPAQLAKFVVDLATMDEAGRTALERKLSNKKKRTKLKSYTPGKRGSTGDE